ARAGVDNITINDLTGTDVQQVNLDLGGNDGQADTVVLNATDGNDNIVVTNNNGVITVTGLSEEVTISNFSADDHLVINGLGGDDVITAVELGNSLQFTANGGDGDDVLIGSAGNDVLTGGAGDDILIGVGGLDVLDGGPGSNIIIPGAQSPVSPVAPTA